MRVRKGHEEISNAEALARLFFPQLVDVMKVLYGITLIVSGWLAVSLQVFVRYDFGERWLSWSRLLAGYTGFAAVYPLFFITRPSSLTLPLITALCLGFFLFTLIHRIRINLRRRKGDPLHSMEIGTPIIARLTGRGWHTYLVIEPLVWGLAGYALALRLDETVGAWLMLASASLFIQNYRAWSAYRTRLTDLDDARKEADHYPQRVWKQESPIQAAGNGRRRFAVQQAEHRKNASWNKADARQPGDIDATVRDVWRD